MAAAHLRTWRVDLRGIAFLLLVHLYRELAQLLVARAGAAGERGPIQQPLGDEVRSGGWARVACV